MPKYTVKGGQWGEGWNVGDVVELDSDAAAGRLEAGELEVFPVEQTGGTLAAAPQIPDQSFEEPKDGVLVDPSRDNSNNVEDNPLPTFKPKRSARLPSTPDVIPDEPKT